MKPERKSELLLSQLAEGERIRRVIKLREHLDEICLFKSPKETHVEFGVLRTHTLVEYCLFEYHRHVLSLKGEKITPYYGFVKKLNSAVALGFCRKNPEMLRRIRIHSKARNQVAHEFELDEKLVDEVVEGLARASTESGPGENRYRMRGPRWFATYVSHEVWGDVLLHLERTMEPKNTPTV